MILYEGRLSIFIMQFVVPSVFLSLPSNNQSEPFVKDKATKYIE